MAQKTHCDICDKVITYRDRKPFRFHEQTIRLGAQHQNADGSNFVPMDLCLPCMLQVITSTQSQEGPDK